MDIGEMLRKLCAYKEVEIHDLREDHDLTQQQVADVLGMTQRKYSYLETGVQAWTPEQLVRLARFYHVSVDYLLFETDDRRRYPSSVLRNTE